MLKVGLIGAGNISTAHVPAWETIADAKLVAVCDARKDQMDQYPGLRQYTDFNEMLEKEELDIVDICLPSFLHRECAVKAMERGIHVLCEKPISLYEKDIDIIYSTAQKMNVNFMVAQVLRFSPEYIIIKELVEKQAYGKLLSGFMRRLSSKPDWTWDNWMGDERRSGLVPFDLHIHDLDFMVYTFGAPEKVQRNRVKRPDQDYIHAVYQYSDFFISAESSWFGCPFPFTASYRFVFEKAIVTCEAGKCIIYENCGKIIDLSADEDDTAPVKLRRIDCFEEEIGYFVDCVKKGVFPDLVKAEELHTVVELLKGF